MKQTDEEPSHLLETEEDEFDAEADERRPRRCRNRSRLRFLHGGPRTFGRRDSGEACSRPADSCTGPACAINRRGGAGDCARVSAVAVAAWPELELAGS